MAQPYKTKTQQGKNPHMARVGRYKVDENLKSIKNAGKKVVGGIKKAGKAIGKILPRVTPGSYHGRTIRRSR